MWSLECPNLHFLLLSNFVQRSSMAVLQRPTCTSLAADDAFLSNETRVEINKRKRPGTLFFFFFFFFKDGTV